jgi:NADH:ubiquinone oxidoreductase subunit 6 (subunit J)
MALALVAFIALVMTIYTFYMVIFSENDEWIKKAKWNLVGIFIALAVIWLAWLIVSVIFWWYEDNWESREWYIETNAPSAVATKEITIDD